MRIKTNWQCCICGTRYFVRGTWRRLIYGCRCCHKGAWQKNNQELMKVEK